MRNNLSFGVRQADSLKERQFLDFPYHFFAYSNLIRHTHRFGMKLPLYHSISLKRNCRKYRISKTSRKKFLFLFAALIFCPPHGLSFWHQPLSCRYKGMAAGFRNKRPSLRFSKKSPHRWVVFFRKTLYFQPRRP